MNLYLERQRLIKEWTALAGEILSDQFTESFEEVTKCIDVGSAIVVWTSVRPLTLESPCNARNAGKLDPKSTW